MSIYEHIFNLQRSVDNLKESVMYWKCKKDLYSEDNPKVRDFVSGKTYNRIENSTSLALYDEYNRPHILGEWEKYFKNVSV